MNNIYFVYVSQCETYKILGYLGRRIQESDRLGPYWFTSTLSFILILHVKCQTFELNFIKVYSMLCCLLPHVIGTLFDSTSLTGHYPLFCNHEDMQPSSL